MDEYTLRTMVLGTMEQDVNELDREEEYSEDEALTGLFKGKSRPDPKVAWEMYNKGLNFNTQINLDETVQVNENFFVGKAA